MTKLKNIKISIIGLGYVGLPLALEFGKFFNVIGYDINKHRIAELNLKRDSNFDINSKDLSKSKFLKFTNNSDLLIDSNVYIVTVPTPINNKLEPELKYLLDATKMISKILQKNDLVIYESTVFPGCTEEKCIPLLEKYSKLKLNNDFYCGFSPERINPGDKKRTLTKIKKVVSGSNSIALKIISQLYKKIIKAGIHEVSSIKIAESAKIIENIQRDINIAFVNELAIFFKKLNLNTEEILKAAETKWNFISFRPGLVGGHCISVDPYYFAYKAKKLGFKPKMTLAGRKINDNMDKFIALDFIKCMNRKFSKIYGLKVLIMGFTFKENCSDIRNTKVIGINKYLKINNFHVDIFDPNINSNTSLKGVKFIDYPSFDTYDGVLITVSHNIFKKIGISKIKQFCKSKSVIYDVKYLFGQNLTDMRL